MDTRLEMVSFQTKGFLWGALLFFLFFKIQPIFAQSVEDQLERYDPNMEIGFSGEVKSINIPPQGMVTIDLKRGEKIYKIYLSPQWFFTEVNPDIKVGDTLEVRGAKLYTPRYGPVFLVRILRNNRTGEEIVFRHQDFKPLWKMRRGGFKGYR